MPSKLLGKYYQARVTYRGMTVFLGQRKTYEEAKALEDAFRARKNIDNSRSAVVKRGWITRKIMEA